MQQDSTSANCTGIHPSTPKIDLGSAMSGVNFTCTGNKVLAAVRIKQYTNCSAGAMLESELTVANGSCVGDTTIASGTATYFCHGNQVTVTQYEPAAHSNQQCKTPIKGRTSIFTGGGDKCHEENVTQISSPAVPSTTNMVHVKLKDKDGNAIQGNPCPGNRHHNCVSFLDIDLDGDFDMMLGTCTDGLWLYNNTGNSTHPQFEREIVWALDHVCVDHWLNSEYCQAAVGHFNGDTLLDVIVSSRYGVAQMYQHKTTPPYFELNAAWTATAGLPTTFYKGGITFGDVDNDGDDDAVVGNEDGTLDYYDRTQLEPPKFELKNTSTAWSSLSVVGNIVAQARPALVDYDGDGDLDLIVRNAFGADSILSLFEQGLCATPCTTTGICNLVTEFMPSCTCSFAGATANSTCNSCDGGYYFNHSDIVGRDSTDGIDDGFCRVCGAGRYGKFKETRQPKDETCATCPSGYFQGIEASPTCSACPTGWHQNGHEFKYCFQIPPGSYTLNGVAKVCERGYTCAGTNASRAPCSKGTYTNNTGSVSCIPCSPGKFSSTQASVKCMDCPSAYFQPDPEQSNCIKVNLGSIVIKGGSASLIVPKGSKINASAPSGFTTCPAGTIGNDPPNAFCTNCTIGKSSTPGATLCSACDKGKSNGQPGHTCEECARETFQDQNTKPSSNCNACPSGFTNKVKGASICQDEGYAKPSDCNALEYLNDTSIDQNDWDCVSCPLGASCSGAINWTGVQAKFGWSRCHNNEAAFAQCTFPAACLGGKNPALMGKYHVYQDNIKIDLAECKASDNCTAQCNTAYANNSFFCGQCAYDYSHDGLTGRCDRCPPLGENIGVAIGGGLFAIVCLIGYILITLSDGGHLDESDGAKSIGLSFIQLISLLVTFPIAW